MKIKDKIQEKNRTGFAYTTFAILAASIILTIVLMPVQSPVNYNPVDSVLVAEASNFHQSQIDDLERASGIAFETANTEAINYITVEGVPLEDYQENIEELMLTAEIEGETQEFMANASLENWEQNLQNVADRAGYEVTVEYQELEVQISDEDEFVLENNFQVFSQLYDTSTNAQFNETTELVLETDINGLEDPYILLNTGDQLQRNINYCGFDTPAETLTTDTGDIGDTSAHGYAVSENDDRTETGLLVDSDIEDSFEPETVQEYGGFISGSPVEDPDEYNDVYATDTDLSNIQTGENQSITITQDGEIWETRFRQIIEEDCYIPVENTENIDAPHLPARLENRNTGDFNTGLVTLLDNEEFTQENTITNIDHTHFQDPNQFTHTEIQGITENQGNTDTRNQFRIDETHTEYWEIDDLVVE